MPYYALRDNYITATEKYGGIPILLPYVNSEIDNYLQFIDGLIITGGNFDILLIYMVMIKYTAKPV